MTIFVQYVSMMCQTSNDIVQRAQTIEDKRVALRLKQDRDHHVAILRRKRKEEAQYHENWNQKIINHNYPKKCFHL